VDDPLNASEAMSKTSRDRVIEWFNQSLYSRLDDKARDAIIVIAQRLHEEDLCGHLLEKGGWAHLNLPAITPEDRKVSLGPTRTHLWKAGTALDEAREPLSSLQETKRSLGSDHFNAQYLQQPVARDGNMLKPQWLRRFDVLPPRQSGDQIVQSWDTAMKAKDTSDCSVCLTFLVHKGNQFYLLDAYRGRPEFPELCKLLISQHKKHQPDAILIEDRMSGTSLIQHAKANGLVGVVESRPTKDKITRMNGQTAKLEGGCLYVPKAAPWLDDFLQEYLAFPKGRYDDQMDALSHFLEWFKQRSSWKWDTGPYDDRPPSPEYVLDMFGKWRR
jgi:predicted phage terminase large subunit-like protein